MMSTKLFYCLFFICCSTFLFAQEVVSVGRYSILYTEEKDKTGDGVKVNYHIYSKLTNKKIFEIEKNYHVSEYNNELKKMFGGANRKFPVWVEDFNFDGNLDFGILGSYAGGAYSQPTYDMYIYDGEKKSFFYHKELSNLTSFGGHGNLKFDSEKKQILYGDSNSSEDTNAAYKVEGLDLITIYSCTTSLMNENRSSVICKSGAEVETELDITADMISIKFMEEGDKCTFTLKIKTADNILLEETGKCEDLYKVLKKW
ncbi:MAG: hypothetical protein GY810_10080 [Aureispira sp.]|nr:hypothetical protein [Aureispira sp.]